MWLVQFNYCYQNMENRQADTSNIKITLYGSMLAATYPNATALAIANPREADFPRPLAAVMTTVLRRVFSEIASIHFNNARAWNDDREG